ncbi:hypothetical protein [Actinoplanes sp. ATCC 53533]|uniref:hypothetical protein n=1 Tax=Actinoplanes sp. ATCC 53533 TaxID=1288362 RepID=UPI0018F30462|nr:hypothetical protein [Actinoplanes sp. ATCC 53533]
MTGPLLAAGREADVYALDDRRVLRRYRRNVDVTAEAAAMRYLGGLLHRSRQLDTLTAAEIGLIGTAAGRIRACAR